MQLRSHVNFINKVLHNSTYNLLAFHTNPSQANTLAIRTISLSALFVFCLQELLDTLTDSHESRWFIDSSVSTHILYTLFLDLDIKQQ